MLPTTENLVQTTLILLETDPNKLSGITLGKY